MSDLFSRAVDLGKEATAFSVKAGANLVERTKEINNQMSGGARFFKAPDEKVQEVRKLLDSSSHRNKLEGMKLLIALISQGRDVSEFFPDVVKNVVTQNHEVRKLVYIYLIRYAEQEPDIALLSINTFQKDLNDHNQLIRALALRVMSSIRVDIIVPIVMIGIKKCSGDLSPYVRKTAALAISKVYKLDPTQKSNLVDIIDSMLNEKSSLVIGSVLCSFSEVCPDRLDLLHKHYRRLCHMLIDVDEWGQIVISNILLRYARTQFLNPNENDEVEEAEHAFYSDEEESRSTESKRKTYLMDTDLRLLLTSCSPLFSSRNTGVVVTAALVYYYLAPRAEFPKAVKPLVNLLSTYPEIQFTVLSNISIMTLTRPMSFEPHLRKFYVSAEDPFYIKELKLEILTRIATEGNISQILKEFQSYIKSSDKEFVTAAIRATGRCAINLPNVAENCLYGLMALISSKNESVVGESVIVIKSLLQLRSDDNTDMIISLAKALKKIHVPMAVASVLWLIGEYCEKIPHIAPDILRQYSKTFSNEDDIVKLQTLNLGAKLYLIGAERGEQLFTYILNLAKYDMNYDIRDRARFLKALCFNSEGKNTTLSTEAKKIIFAPKQAAQFESVSEGRERFVLGTLSQILNKPIGGYEELPSWPETQPNPHVREVKEERYYTKNETLLVEGDKKKQKRDKKYENLESFLNSGDEESDYSYSDTDSYSDRSRSRSRSYSRSRSRSYSRSRSRSYSRSRSRSYSSRSRSYSRSRSRSYSRSRSRTPSSAYSYSDSDSERETYKQPPQKQTQQPPAKTSSTTQSTQKTSKPTPKKETSLLDFDPLEDTGSTSVPVISTDLLGLTLTPTSSSQTSTNVQDEPLADIKLPSIKFKQYPLLSHMIGKGLHIEYFFGRRTSLYPNRMNSIQLVITNKGQKTITDIHLGTDNLEKSVELVPFTPIPELSPGEATEVNLNVDFNQKTTAINFQICTDDGKFPVKIEPSIGELVYPKVVSMSTFNTLKAKLGGMLEQNSSIPEGDLGWDIVALTKKVYRAVNVSPIENYSKSNSNISQLLFYGELLSSNKPVLIIVKAPSDGKIKFSVHCELSMTTPAILKTLKDSLNDSS